MGSFGRRAILIVLMVTAVRPAAEARSSSALVAARQQCTSFYQKISRLFRTENDNAVAAALPLRVAEPRALRDRGVVTIGGERYLKFERDSSTWVKLSVSDYFRGDPQWNIDLAGRKTMEDFGFRYEERAVFTPVAETYNARIQNVNRTLKPDDQIVLRYYTPDVDKVSDEDYLRGLGRFEHPASIGNKGAADEASHDANFHPPLLPKSWYEQIARRSRAYVGFVDWLRANRPALYESGAKEKLTLKRFLNDKLKSAAKDFDLVTAVALAHPDFPQQYYPLQSKWTGGYAGMVRLQLFDGRTPLDLVKDFKSAMGDVPGFSEACDAYAKTVEGRADYNISISKTTAEVKHELDERLNMFRARK
jgi:hypothetical protein